MTSRIGLGTVQFGLHYGIANKGGQVSRGTAGAILALAETSGVDTLDTAIAYGDSEACLGEVGANRFKIVTKLPTVPENVTDVRRWVHDQTQASLRRLRAPRVYGLLLHRSRAALGRDGEAVVQALGQLKAAGVVQKIGVSIYDPDELDALWPYFRCDLVQAPYNILDRRLATSGWLDKLKQSGAEVHARSAFLQGLLLMDAAARPTYFDRWRPLWNLWSQWLTENDLSPLRASLGFALARSEIDRVIVGVDSLDHLRDALSASDKADREPPVDLVSTDLDLLDPSKWPTH